MTQPTRRIPKATQDAKDMEYWRGMTDQCLETMQKNLGELKDMVEALQKDFTAMRRDLSEWRSNTENRLASGSVRFDMTEKRLDQTETRLHVVETIVKKNGNDKKQFGSWDWFRDELIMPVIKWALLTGAAALLYVVAKRIVETM